MSTFSPGQTARITDAAKNIAQKRDVIERLEGELAMAKDNLKLAKTEMNFAQNDLRSATQDALAGKEPLPNLFRGREAAN